LSDFSTRPLVYADAIARWYGGRLTVLHVAPSFDPIEVRAGALFDPVQFAYPMSREQVIDELRRALVAADISTDRVDLAAAAGEPAAVIVDQSLATTADLVVMATHGRSGVDRLLLGSVTEKVLRRAPCPVLTVPPHVGQSRSDVQPRQILCAMDRSPAALQALGYALDLAQHTAAAVTVLQVIEWLAEEEPRELRHFSVPEFRRALEKDTQDSLEALLAEQPRQEPAAVAAVRVGRAYREILRAAADLSADLIVMGAQGRGGPDLNPFGSTAQQVVRAAGCPVLTVRVLSASVSE
jgi:nucleotide-binding universal stress UspA family protein